MINNEKRGIELYHQPQEGATGHSMPALLNQGETWQPRNMNGGDINTPSSSYNGHGAKADLSGLHNIRTNWNNNSRNVTHESVIVRNNKPASTTFDHLRAEVAGLIGLDQFKFVSSPIQGHATAGNVRSNGHKHTNATGNLNSQSKASQDQLQSHIILSSGANSPPYTVDKSARGYLKNKTTLFIANKTPPATQSLEFYVLPPPPYQSKNGNEPKPANLQFHGSEGNVKTQPRQNIIKNSRKRNVPFTYTESVTTSVLSSTTGAPRKVVTVIRPTKSAKKSVTMSHPEFVAQYGAGTQSTSANLQPPNFSYIGAPVTLVPISDAKTRDPDCLNGDHSTMSVEAIPQIVSLYSLSDASKRSPETSPQQTKTRRRKKKPLPLDSTKLKAAKTGSNDVSHPTTTGNRAQIISDPNLHFAHAVSKNKTPKKINNTPKEKNSKFSISSSSLEAWFKSTQSSALEMQVLKSPPSCSSRPSESNAPTTTNSSNGRDSVITIQEMKPLNPQIDFSKVFQFNLPDSNHLGNSGVPSFPVSENITDKKPQVRGNTKSRVSKTKNKGFSANGSSQNTTLKSIKTSSPRQVMTNPNAVSSGMNSSSKPTSITAVASEPSSIEKTVADTNTNWPDTPLDYSMKTLNKTLQKQEEMQSQPLDLTVSKKPTQPLFHQEKAFDDKLTGKDSSSSSLFSEPKPKPDLIMRAIDRVISQSKAYALLPDQKKLVYLHSEIKQGSTLDTSAKAPPSITSPSSTVPVVGAESIPISTVLSSAQNVVPKVKSNVAEVVTPSKASINVPASLPSVSHVSVSDVSPGITKSSQVNDASSTETYVETVNSQEDIVTTDNTSTELISTEIKPAEQSTVENLQENVSELTEKSTQNADIEVPDDVSSEETLVEVKSTAANDSPEESDDEVVEVQENLTQVAGVQDEEEVFNDSPDMETETEVHGKLSDKSPKISSQLVVKVRKISDGEFRIIHSTDVEKDEEIPNDQNVADPDINKSDADAIPSQETNTEVKEDSQHEVSIEDFDIIRTIPHVAKPGQDFFELEEACCDEYDNMHFIEEESLEFGDAGNQETFEEMEKENPDLSEDTDSSDKSQEAENKVVHVREYSQESHTKATETNYHNTKDVSQEDGQTHFLQSQTSFQDKTHHLQPFEMVESSPVKADVPDVHDSIPTIKEEILENKSPTSLKRKSSIKLGYNVNCDIKSPELMKKRRKLIAKDIKPVIKVSKTKTSCAIVLSDSDGSSEESEEMFKTAKFKKANSKRRMKDTSMTKSPEPKNATHLLEPNLEAVHTNKNVTSNSSGGSLDTLESGSSEETTKFKKRRGRKPKRVSNNSTDIVETSVSKSPASSSDKLEDVSSDEEAMFKTLKLKKGTAKRRTKDKTLTKSPERKGATQPSMDMPQASKDAVYSKLADGSSEESQQIFSSSKSKTPTTEHSTREIHTTKSLESRNVTQPGKPKTETVQTKEHLIGSKPSVNSLNDVTHFSEKNMKSVQIKEHVAASNPLVDLPNSVTDVVPPKTSIKEEDEADSDEALKNIVDKIIFSTSVKVTNEAVKRKKAGKVSCSESNSSLTTNVEPAREKGLAARMGNWSIKNIPVITKVPIRPLPCYEKAKTQRKNIYEYENLMILQDLVKLGILMNESNMPDPKETEYNSKSSVLTNEFNDMSSIHIAEGVKLRPCFVRLEKLNIEMR